MTDRLTLETADPLDDVEYHLQAISAATHASKAKFAENIRVSLVAIDLAVRAYRERLPAERVFTPEPDCNPCDVKPYGDGQWGRCDKCGDDSFPISDEAAGLGPRDQWNPAGDGCTRCAGHGCNACEPPIERGPTEGASDAATEKALRDLGSSDVGTVFDVRMEYGSGKSRVWEYMGRHPQPGSPDAYRFKDERGGFAHLNHPDWRLVRPPTGEASPDIADEAGVWEKRSRAYRKCADRFQAERNEVEDRLGTLIGAVEDAIDIEHETPVVTIRAALDAAKGDAPTGTPSPTTPAPQAPDSPGLWFYTNTAARELVAEVVQHGPRLCFHTTDGTRNWPVEDALGEWGGRCTRDAPDDGLRARAEAAWAAFENDDGFDGSLRGAQLADRLRKALDGS